MKTDDDRFRQNTLIIINKSCHELMTCATSSGSLYGQVIIEYIKYVEKYVENITIVQCYNYQRVRSFSCFIKKSFLHRAI